MPFKKGQGGRPKGAKNKTTVSVKEALALAAEQLGGTTRLVAWVQEDPKNEYAFWTLIYPKLVPHELTGGDGAPLIPAAGITFNVRQIPDAVNKT